MTNGVPKRGASCGASDGIDDRSCGSGDPEGIRGRRRHRKAARMRGTEIRELIRPKIDPRLKRWGITVVPVLTRQSDLSA
jgi:hypothetical protein